MATRTFVEGSPLRCPFCHEGVDLDGQAWVACATCLARHHAECWDEGSACAACGRDQRLVLAASPARATPVPPASGTATVHVDPGRPGACATIAEALAAVAPGGRVVLAPGTYRERFVLDRDVTLEGATSRREVILEPENGDGIVATAEKATLAKLTICLIVRGLGVENFAAVRVTSGRLKIRDCAIRSQAVAPALVVEGRGARPHVEHSTVQGHGTAILVGGGATGVFEHCEVAGGKMTAFSLRDDADPHVEGCRVHGGKFGIHVEDGARGTFRACEVTLSREAGVRVTTHGCPRLERCRVRDVPGDGVRVEDQGEGIYEDLMVLRCGRSGIVVERGGDPSIVRARVSAAGHSGVAFRASARGRLEDSRVSENGGAGVEIAHGAVPIVRGCRILANDGAGVEVRGAGGGRVEKCEITANRDGAWRDPEGRIERRENADS